VEVRAEVWPCSATSARFLWFYVPASARTARKHCTRAAKSRKSCPWSCLALRDHNRFCSRLDSSLTVTTAVV
jgi:hypothetical protein